MTGHNWETNASNAGQDYLHQSDNCLLWSNGLSDAEGATPAIVVTRFHDQSLAVGTPYTVVTIPMAGYVAADMNGPVTPAQVAPSNRWVEIKPTKPTALSLTPDLTDGKVYTDEFLAFLQHRYGSASGATGIRGYNLDNEPELWATTGTMRPESCSWKCTTPIEPHSLVGNRQTRSKQKKPDAVERPADSAG